MTEQNQRLDEKRTAVLKAAMQVFLERGYEGVNIEQVAQAAGVVRRTVYNLFPDGKESLFRAAVALFWDGFPKFSWEQMDKRTPQEALTYAAEAIVTFWKSDDAIRFLRLAIAELPRFPDLMDQIALKAKLPMMSEMERYLRQQARLGTLRIADPELAMRQFFGLVSEPLLWPRVLWQMDGLSAARQKRVITEAVEMFLAFTAVR